MLLYVPQLSKVVGETSLICWLAPIPRVGKVQLSTPRLMSQPVTVGSIVQLRPGPEGRVSLTSTLVAGAVPVLVTVMMKLIGSPALTGEATVLLSMASCGAQVTSMVAEPVT